MENKFYVCRECGLTFKAKRKPKQCKLCKSKILGELQIKWNKN